MNATGNVDRVVENWQAQLWEDLNTPDPGYENWPEAISTVQAARDLILQASTKLDAAAEMTHGTGAEHRIASLAMQLDNIARAVYGQIWDMQH